MNVTPVRTHKITPKDRDLLAILDKYIPKLDEKSIVIIASKIVSISEGRVVPVSMVETSTPTLAGTTKLDLIEEEADWYLEPHENKYGLTITIKDHHLIAAAGIDASNGGEYYVLWPKDSQKTAERVRNHLVEEFKNKHIGVIIVDSQTNPMRWGTTGFALGYAGFEPLRDYIGKSDLFGREMQFTQASVVDGLAAAAVLTMGEGSEQTPLALITDIPFVKFQDRNPTKEEVDSLKIDREDDLYGPMLTAASWKKGRKK